MRPLNTFRILRIFAIIVSTCLISMAVLAGYIHWRVHRYDNLIAGACALNDVDPLLVVAVIKRESGFKPRAIGKSGEVGLMQVTEPAAQEWAEAKGIRSVNKADLFTPEVNIHVGTWYLGRAIRRWSHKENPLPYALAEYNAGRSNARRWAANNADDPCEFLTAITYPTTRRYIQDILKDYYRRSSAESNCISYNRR